jgi:hypothetical protein
MEIEIIITGNRYNNDITSFGQSFVTLINDDSSLKSIIEDNPEVIAVLIKKELTDGIESIIPKHLTIDNDFVLKLNILDSIDCTCLQGKSQLGSVLKEIMIDNYQLVLTRKHWRETDKLNLFFDAVEFGGVDDFIRYILKRKKAKKTY